MLDGEILPWNGGGPLPFAQMQRRIGRKVLGPKILADVPVVLLAYDLLEWQGEDIREWPLERRRAQLEALAAALASTGRIVLSAAVPFATWEELAELRRESRERGAWKASC